MVLQAVVDDSGRGGGPVFVLAGFVLSAEEWIGFSDQWKAVLDAAPRIDYFKMKEAMRCGGQFAGFSARQRDRKLQEAISLILTYKPLALRSVIPAEPYKRIFKHKISPAIDHPYFLSYFGVIGALIRHQITKGWFPTAQVDFIFDEQGKESAVVERAWSLALSLAPDSFRSLLGQRPIHRDDKKFVPLQAADLFAWHSRRLYSAQLGGSLYNDPVQSALSTLECAEDVWTEQRLDFILRGVRSQGKIHEYDMGSPKLRKRFKKILGDTLSKIGSKD